MTSWSKSLRVRALAGARRHAMRPVGALAVAALVACGLTAVVTSGSRPACAAEQTFPQFLESLWPDAKAAGVSRAVFDQAIAGLQPDMSLPDLAPGGTPKKADSRGQAEFTRAPADYLDKTYLGRLAKTGRELAEKYARQLDRDVVVKRRSHYA